jgi:hypothetical protein
VNTTRELEEKGSTIIFKKKMPSSVAELEAKGRRKNEEEMKILIFLPH